MLAGQAVPGTRRPPTTRMTAVRRSQRETRPDPGRAPQATPHATRPLEAVKSVNGETRKRADTVMETATDGNPKFPDQDPCRLGKCDPIS